MTSIAGARALPASRAIHFSWSWLWLLYFSWPWGAAALPGRANAPLHILTSLPLLTATDAMADLVLGPTILFNLRCSNGDFRSVQCTPRLSIDSAEALENS